MYFGYLPRYTMYDCSPLPMWHSAQLECMALNPLFIYTSFNTQLKYHLIYEAFPSQINYGSFCLLSHPYGLSVTKTHFISFYLTI